MDKRAVLADWLRKQIVGGELRPHHPVPAAGDLAERFGCPATDAAEVLGELEAQKVLYLVPGAGYHVEGGTKF